VTGGIEYIFIKSLTKKFLQGLRILFKCQSLASGGKMMA